MRSRPRRTDWHAVFEDIAALGFTGDELAERIGFRVGLLQRVATGRIQPAPVVAERIVDLWLVLTGKPAQFLPQTSAAEDSSRPEVPGLDRNDTAPAAHLALHGAISGWWAQH